MRENIIINVMIISCACQANTTKVTSGKSNGWIVVWMEWMEDSPFFQSSRMMTLLLWAEYRDRHLLRQFSGCSRLIGAPRSWGTWKGFQRNVEIENKHKKKPQKIIYQVFLERFPRVPTVQKQLFIRIFVLFVFLERSEADWWVNTAFTVAFGRYFVWVRLLIKWSICPVFDSLWMLKCEYKKGAMLMMLPAAP